MAMLSLSPLLALAACFSASYAQDGPNKTAVDPSFDMFGGMSEVIGSHLPFQKYIVSYWDKGWIPHDCAFHAEAFGYAAADLEAFNLTFPDCDEPWVTCRHKDTKTSISTIGYMLGTIPVGMRDFLKHMIAIPSFHGPYCGMTSGSNTMIQDTCWIYNVLLHELSHSMDWNALKHEVGPDGSFSSGQKWQSEYSKDQRTISQYGLTSWREDFADSGVVAFYDLIVPKGVPAIQANWSQVQHQYSTFKQYFQQFIISPDPHARCKNRVNNSEPIAVGHAVRPGILTFDTKKIEESPASRHTCRFPHWSVKN